MTKAPYQQLVSTGEIVGAAPFDVPLSKKLRIPVPKKLQNRRIYLGFLYAAYTGTVGTGKEVGVVVSFGRDGDRLRFCWTDNGIPIAGGVEVPTDGSGIVPPFSVERFAVGTSPTFVSTVPFNPDEMVAMGLNSATGDTHLVRMAAIPVVSDSDEITAEFSWDVPSATSDYFQAWFGVRANPV